MAKRSNDFESARASILNTATELVTQYGVRNTSLADIAKEAKISKGTLYYYYPSKEILISDIADYHLGCMTDILFTWIDEVSRDSELEAPALRLIDRFLDDEICVKRHVVLLSEAALGNVPVQKKFTAKYREWAVMLEVGALKMPPKQGEAFRRRLQDFFMLLDGFMMHSLITPDGLDRKKLTKYMLEE